MFAAICLGFQKSLARTTRRVTHNTKVAAPVLVCAGVCARRTIALCDGLCGDCCCVFKGVVLSCSLCCCCVHMLQPSIKKRARARARAPCTTPPRIVDNKQTPLSDPQLAAQVLSKRRGSVSRPTFAALSVQSMRELADKRQKVWAGRREPCMRLCRSLLRRHSVLISV